MKRTELSVVDRELRSVLVARTKGRAFHVSCAKNVPAILAAGAIRANVDGSLPTAFGSSKNSLFRLRGCVSVFDYRDVPEAEFEAAWIKCNPGNAVRTCEGNIALFFLRPSEHDSLQSWRIWKEEELYSQMVVPWVEAGYPGDIDLEVVEELVEISVVRTPHPLIDALEAARLRAIQSERQRDPDTAV